MCSTIALKSYPESLQEKEMWSGWWNCVNSDRNRFGERGLTNHILSVCHIYRHTQSTGSGQGKKAVRNLKLWGG